MHSKKLIYFLISCSVILLLFIFVVICPLANMVRSSSREFLENQDILAKFYQREEILKILQKRYKEDQDNLARLDGVFLKPEDTVGFITSLEKVAQQTNNYFEIKSVKSFNLSNDERSSLSFQINIWGDFASFMKFLTGLEDTPYPPYRLVKIGDIDVRKLAITDLAKYPDFDLGIGDLEASLNIKVYTQ